MSSTSENMQHIKALGHLVSIYNQCRIKCDENYNYSKNSIDIRRRVFSQISNTIYSASLSLNYHEGHLKFQEYWNRSTKDSIPVSDMTIHNKEFLIFAKIGLLQFPFSVLENYCRLLVRALDPEACNKGTADFKNIYSYLLTKCNLIKYENILDIYRLSRNVIHNNGFYFHRKGNNEVVTYNDVEYSFIIGEAINHVTWEFLINLLEELSEIISDISNSEIISSISSIPDNIIITD